jgi:Arc/MetJ-type ribon-helix-helix transcriptional regulator
MTIALDKRHLKLLEEAVAAGHFVTIEEAAAFAIEQLLPIEPDQGLDQVRQALDEARAELARGEYLTFEDMRASLKARKARRVG